MAGEVFFWFSPCVIFMDPLSKLFCDMCLEGLILLILWHDSPVNVSFPSIIGMLEILQDYITIVNEVLLGVLDAISWPLPFESCVDASDVSTRYSTLSPWLLWLGLLEYLLLLLW